MNVRNASLLYTEKRGNGTFYICYNDENKESLGQKTGFDVDYGKMKEGLKKCIAVYFISSYFQSQGYGFGKQGF